MGAPLYRDRYRVPSARMSGWDYRWSGVYAVTICVLDRLECLGALSEGSVQFTPFGAIVAGAWQEIPHIHPRVSLDEWIVMPDHLHGILIFGPPDPRAVPLGTIIGQFKKRSTKRIRAMGAPQFAWQERYFDQILPDARALDRYRSYIRHNPKTKNNGP